MEKRDDVCLRLGRVLAPACLLLLLVYLSAGFAVSRADSAAPQACVPGPHTGTLTSDETWCAVDSPHEVLVQFTVPSTYTLTIEPGVVVSTNVGTHRDFLVEGRLEALGTAAQPITFTSPEDTAPGQWGGLAFDGGTGHLRHVTIRYTGRINSVSGLVPLPWYSSGIAIHDGTLRLENTTLRDQATNNYDHGLIAIDSHIMLTDSLFTAIGGAALAESDAPIRLLGPDTVLEMSGNTFTGNTNDLIVLEPGAMMGQDTTLIPQNGLDGYVLEKRGFTVPPTITLTIAPGTTVRGHRGGNDSSELRIEGHLEAIGTPTQPITFTSVDDSAPCQWRGLVFDGSEGGGTGDLRYATIRYGGIANSVLESITTDIHNGSNVTAYNVTNGEVRLEHVTVEDEYHFDGWHNQLDHGLYINNSQVAVVDSIIQDNCDSTAAMGSQDSGVYVTGDSTLFIDGSLIESNSAVGLLVESDTAFVQVSGSSIANNIGDGVLNTGSATVILGVDAESGNAIHDNQGFGVNQEGTSGQTLAFDNWWGAASGPTHAGNPGGTGEAVTDRVLYDPWLTVAPAPPAARVQLVQLAAPARASVGQTVNLGVFFQNVGAETLEDAIVVLEIPWRAEYHYSTQDGQFWPLHNRVIWKLGDAAPGYTFSAIAQVRYKWWTPNGTVMPVSVMAAADNRRNSRLTYEQHLAYEELDVTGEQALTQAEVDTVLANDAELKALFEHAKAQGFEYYGNAMQLTLGDGTEWFELLLMDLDRPGVMLAVRRTGEDRHIRQETEADVSLYTLTGGSRFDYETAEWTFWGDMAATTLSASSSGNSAGFSPLTSVDACPHHDWGDCLRNCLITQMPTEMSDPSLFGGISSCEACVACEENCLGICSSCARDQWKPHHNEHFHNCTKECADSDNWNNYQCDNKNLQECWDAPRNESAHGRSQYRMTYTCDEGTCQYEPNPTLEYCPHGCIYGDSDTAGSLVDTRCVPCNSFWDYLTEEACTRALTAHDPNALYGPEVAAPGQTIEYTVEWENEGQGTAYGVYVESYLPPELDDSTLQIGGNGTYFPGSRTLMWQIGELGAGAGNSVTYTVQVPASAISGTVMVAKATVYFPSVPESTPTNPVVTVVQDVAANGQQVITDRDTPVIITLSGYTPTSSPLQFAIGDEPLNGTLTGTPPNLTYTPAAKFEGLDGFEFMTSDGLNTSLPAMVTIVVNPPPRVYLPVIFSHD